MRLAIMQMIYSVVVIVIVIIAIQIIVLARALLADGRVLDHDLRLA